MAGIDFNQIPFFDELKGMELDVIAKMLVPQSYGRGNAIFYEGDPGHAMYFIQEGQVNIAKAADDGTIKTLTIVNPRSILGEMALIDRSTRSATAIARNDVRLVSLSAKDFDVLVDQYPRVAVKILLKLLRIVSMRLRKTSADLVDSLHQEDE